MEERTLTSELLLSADPESLNKILVSEFMFPMMEKVETVEDMQTASNSMAKIVGYLQFLVPQLTLMKIKTQNYKAIGDKENYKVMMQRRDVVDAICEILKTQRDTLSRMITIKQEINKEMHLV